MARFIWNKAVAYIKENKFESYFTLTKLLTQWKQDPELEFLKEYPTSVLRKPLKSLELAWRMKFKKAGGFPKFHNKYTKKSFGYLCPLKVAEDTVYFPKIGPVKFHKHREILGEIKTATVSFSCGHWYVSLQTQYEQEFIPNEGPKVGIDLGVTNFATTSEGKKILAPVDKIKQIEKKIAKTQKALARKTPKGKNWIKNKYQLQKLYKNKADVQDNFLHHTSSDITKTYSEIVMEDLKITNMTASAKGTVDNPGKNVKQKSGLNRNILNQKWAGFVNQIEYKSVRNGSKLSTINPKYTSQKCSNCGHTQKENRKTQSRFECLSCGFIIHSDENAAKNILSEGMSDCGNIDSVKSLSPRST